MTTPTEEELVGALTITELCKRWKTSRQAIWGAIKAGKLRPFKIGKRTLRFAAAEVERFEREQVVA